MVRLILYAKIFFFPKPSGRKKKFEKASLPPPSGSHCLRVSLSSACVHVCVRVCVPEGAGGVSYCRLAFAAGAESVVEASPGLKGFARPDPEASCDPNNHGHEVLNHEDREVWAHRGKVAGTGHGIGFAGLEEPRLLPGATEGLLVEVTCQDNGGRHRVEDTEDTDAHHQFLQFLRLGAVMLHDGADTEQGHKASK